MKNIPGIKTLSLLLITLFSASAAVAQAPAAQSNAGDPNSIEAISARIAYNEKRETETEEKVVAQIKKIKNTVDAYSKSERELKGLNGLGKIEQLKLKADRYAVEKQAREIIQEEVYELMELISEWQKYQNELKREKKFLALKQKVMEMQKSTEMSTVSLDLNQKNIEYYTIKKPMTLQEISSLPDVYGNPSSWQYLFNANRNKVKDPTKKLPAGTTLVVPSIKIETEFDELD